MRLFASFCRVLVWVVLALTAIPQIMAVIGIYFGNSTELFNPVLLIVATALMFIAVVLFFAIPRGKLIPLLLAAAAAAFFIILALKLMDVFPVTVTLTKNAGISLWRAMYRHMSPVLIPLLMFPVFWEYHTDRKASLLAEADRLTPTYFEGEQPAETVEHKPKRSVRARLSKQSEDTE